MLEELGLDELNPLTILITLVAYGGCMLVLWKGVGGWLIKDQIIISVVALPILYFAISFQMNR